MNIAGWFSLCIGLLMLGQWTFFLLSGQVPELKTKPAEIVLHITAEFVTAIALLVAGVGLLLATSWGIFLYLVATGMLLYTLIVSPGYYVQRRTWPLVTMFAVILVLTLILLGISISQIIPR